MPDAMSWPVWRAAAGYQISQGNNRCRAVSSASIVRTPTDSDPGQMDRTRLRGMPLRFRDVQYDVAIHFP